MKKCHDCKSTNVAKILYGYPADMDKWKKDMDSGKFVAGGVWLEMTIQNGNVKIVGIDSRYNQN